MALIFSFRVNALEGLKAGIIDAGILMGVLLLKLRPFFAALFFILKRPNRLNDTCSLF
jgi:hypothetical protein